jgi:four helix bundle protein
MFNEELRKRSYELTKYIILTLRSVPEKLESKIICTQLIRSSSSVAANFRAACNSRSQNEWFAKICIVTEEIDETCFWLDLIIDLNKDSDLTNFLDLRKEANELVKIFSTVKAKASLKRKLN